MLYVSGFAGQLKYIITDTDDGSETIAVWPEIEDYCINLGLDIKGVILGEKTVRGRTKLGIKSISIYQHPEEVTRQQAKLKVLKGVDVVVNAGRIALIKAHMDGAGTIRLKLSDYGTVCGDYILMEMHYVRGFTLILELDDSIVLTSKSLSYFIERGVVVDLLGVTNKKTIQYVTAEVARSSYRYLSLGAEAIIDTHERINLYKAIAVLNREENTLPNLSTIEDLIPDCAEVQKVIAKKYRAEFKSISEANFDTKSASVRWAMVSRPFVVWLSANKGLLTWEEYAWLRGTRFMEIFGVLKEISTCTPSVLTRFSNYVRFFDVSPEIQESFVRLCQRAGDWLLTVGYQMKWIERGDPVRAVYQ